MPRNDGNTPSRNRRKHAGHRIHRRGRIARKVARLGKGRGLSPWRRGVV